MIGVGAAFQTEITKTMSGIPLEEVLRNIKAGIEEEGMTSRVVKVLDTSDVGFMGLEAAKLSGSGIGIGLQSKGTTVIHQKDLYPLSNLELFPQAPLMDLDTYRKIGRNAAKYVKGEKVTPIECTNDPMVRAKYQVKAALLHIIETEQLDPAKGMIEWRVQDEQLSFRTERSGYHYFKTGKKLSQITLDEVKKAMSQQMTSRFPLKH